ncbi:unnamed protein product [Caenorhabditis bovis]|uniref:MD-2-related lipid-recognition domain-containing protein n=1 Tax=Caenorhabditis bovis TaxID=2654633 RepID=A0A8S1FCI4_9PELO|nr:unnamed protein product [Caenorhabditis bovis]
MSFIFQTLIFLVLISIVSPSNEETEIKTPLRFRALRNFGSSEVSAEQIADAPESQPIKREEPFLLADSSTEQEEECEALPNRTRTRPSFFQCRENTKLELHGGAITNINGDDTYPVSFASPIRVFLDVSSNTNKRYDNLGVEVSLFKRSTGWFGCGWLFLPSFGLLSNYEMCDDNPSCPITPGRQVIEFEIDPTKLFTNVFRLIHYDLSAYQLVVKIRDNRDPYRELLCATIQTRIIL